MPLEWLEVLCRLDPVGNLDVIQQWACYGPVWAEHAVTAALLLTVIEPPSAEREAARLWSLYSQLLPSEDALTVPVLFSEAQLQALQVGFWGSSRSCNRSSL